MVLAENRSPTFSDHLGEQDRRQPLSPLDRGLVGWPPRLKELHKLLAGAVVSPSAVALDDFEQPVGRLGAVASGVERNGEVESGLMIQRIRSDLLFEFVDRTERLGLLGEVDGRLHSLDRGVLAL